MNMETNVLSGRLAIFRINYKSDFILTLESDAGWMTPFCIKFWTGAPSQAYYVGWDGTTYTHCAPVEGEPTKLQVQFDNHHLPIGELKYQVAYHFTVDDFPNDTEDEVINQDAVIIDNNGRNEKVLLDFNGETAPDIAFSLPAYANEAQRIANEQQRIANEQQRIANEESRIAAETIRQQNEAQRIAQETARVNEFATLKSQSQAATRDANDAATLANQKAQLAADKAALAYDAATLANQKAQLAADKAALANDAAQLAADKAALAQQKAEYAQTQGGYAKDQGDYAKNQGNYAKEQGEIAQSDHQRAEADHGIAVDDHTQAGNDHTRAEADHGIAADDHTLAGNDHTRAESDHGIAVDDHTQAGNDHTRAESDHGIAADDHTQAGNDHTRAESDHTRAESDHAAVEVYVDSLGAFDISSYHATGGVLAKYADLTAALGTNGANIPEAIRKGGMSVKFVQSSDNKYVQARCTADEFTTDITQWQCVVEKPAAGSMDIVTSDGIIKFGELIAEGNGNLKQLSPSLINNKYISISGDVASASGYSYSEPITLNRGEFIIVETGGGNGYAQLSKVITADIAYEPLFVKTASSTSSIFYIADATVSVAICGQTDPIKLYKIEHIANTLGDSQKLSASQKLLTDIVTKIPTCESAASDANKNITIDGWNEAFGAHHIIRFTNTNSANNATISINSSSPKPLWYHNKRVSVDNKWIANRMYLLLSISTDYLLGDFDWEGNEAVSSFGNSNSPVSQVLITNLLAREIICATAGDNPSKEITINSWQTTLGTHHWIKFTHANTADDATLSINGDTAYPLYYHNKRVSSYNTLKDGGRYLLYWNGFEYLLGDFDWEDVDNIKRAITLQKTTWVSTIRNHVLKEENGYLYYSSDLGKTWSAGLENTIGDIMFVHWFNDGTCLICGTQTAYWTKGFDELHQSTVLDYDGNPFVPTMSNDRHFFADCTYNSPYWIIDGKETAIWGDYGPGNGNQSAYSGYEGRIWMSNDNGQTVKCILKGGEGVLSSGIRHFHWVQWDEYDDCLWATTGDSSSESCLLKGTINQGVWTFIKIRSGADCKYGQVFADKKNLYLITDYTEGGANTGLVVVDKGKAAISSAYQYIYRNEYNIPFGSIFDDGQGHRLLTTDSSRYREIYYAKNNFNFKQLSVGLNTTSSQDTARAISSIYGMNWNGDGILLVKPRPTSYETWYGMLCLNLPDRFDFFTGMREANYDFASPTIKAFLKE